MSGPKFSPHKSPGSGVSTFVSHQAPNSTDIRSAIREELSGKVTVDPEQVLRRLRTEAIPTQFVDGFLKNFQERNFDAISALKAIAQDARGANKQPKKANEKAMYPYLQKILDDIVDFEPGTYSRRFYNTHNTPVKGEAHLSGFPSLSPDFCCCPEPFLHQQPNTWRGMDSFLEVKPSSLQGVIPKNPDTNKVLKTLSQTADYARLHLSSRPFQLFSVAVVISGSNFAVVIFDRDGVTVSTDFDLWDNIDIFVRVLRQITCGLSPIELGADPSVQELEANNPLYAQIRQKSATMHVSHNYPSYRIKCPRKLNPRHATPFATTSEVSWVSDEWVTVGPPIWSSLSLCGRATTVWRVTLMENNGIPNIDNVCILKNAWRRSNRDSESEIYESIPTRPVGVAEFLQGGDVMAPGSTDVISVDLLRNFATHVSDQPTLILHRLVLKTTGRALWECDSFLEIVKGVRAALNGHKQLYDQRILHRDVSPGNVLLSAKPSAQPGEEGFLTDLEFARISTIVTQDVQEHSLKDGNLTQSTHTRYKDAKRGAVMTGTVHFMAIELVEAMMFKGQVEHKVHHDVESFIWVFAYAVARRLINTNSKADSETRDEISSFFGAAWGGVSLRAIHTTKRALNPLHPSQLIQPLFPAPILSLFVTLGDLLLYRMLRGSTHQPSPLGHKELLQALDDCVVGLQSPGYDGPK